MSDKKTLEELFETPELSEEEAEQVSGGILSAPKTLAVAALKPASPGSLSAILATSFSSVKFGSVLRPDQDVGH